MELQFKLGQTFGTKDNEITRQFGMCGEYTVIILLDLENEKLVFLTINSRKNFVGGPKYYGEYEDLFEEVEIRAIDLLHDEICIKDNVSGTVKYGDAIMLIGENKIIHFTPIGNDLIANVQYKIKTISGELLTGFLYCTTKPKFYI